MIIGEIKSLNKGVIKIGTSYSDEDFSIEWKKVKKINTYTHFHIYLSDGTQFFSTINSLNDSICQVITFNNQSITCAIKDIIFLKPYKDKFGDRFDASISFGLNITKAQQSMTITTRSNIGYQAEKWSTDAVFDTYRNTRDSADKIMRSELIYNFRYFFQRKLYGIFSSSAYSNTEQKLDLRLNNQLGIGLFLSASSTGYWGAKTGINRNIEEYSNETSNRSTWEGYLGTELNLYGKADITLLFSSTFYISVSDWGRWRSDTNFDLKYDLPLDFYIKIGTTFNYDSKPAEGADKWDYVFSSSLGWEW